MSNTWNEGYFTEIGYTHGYYRELNPTFQRFCLLLRGFVVLESENMQHCELGFGQGVSINAHAAANSGIFYGTDFSPAQASQAIELAQASGSGAKLFDDSFEQLLKRNDLPQFDSISLHGIWTWVSRNNHNVIAEFIRRYLKPGGTLYISYNCFPGWSPAYPLRQLFALHDRFVRSSSSAEVRVNAALTFSENLLAAQPSYLKAVPDLHERLKNITKQGRQYLAHEYFNQDWNCMYFTEVVDALAQTKLDYACSAVPLDVLDSLNLSKDAIDFLESVDHPILREQSRDYFVNQQFRKDLYVKGARRLPPGKQKQLFLNMYFVLIQFPKDIPLKITGALGEGTLQEAIYNPIIATLASNNYAAKTLREILEDLTILNYTQALEAVTVLVNMGAVSPCHTAEPTIEKYASCNALNLHLMEKAQYGNEIELLVSPIVGGGVPVRRFHQLFLLARSVGEQAPDAWAEHALKVIAAQGQKILKDGVTLETAEESLDELILQANEFMEKQLPILKSLKIAIELPIKD